MAKKKQADAVVEVDRRAEDRRTENVAVAGERRKTPRRRQIDPTTCERDYTDDEVEFMHALDDYKRRNGRMFPTCSEILEVVRDLGYNRPQSGNDQIGAPSSEDTSLANHSELEEAID